MYFRLVQFLNLKSDMGRVRRQFAADRTSYYYEAPSALFRSLIYRHASERSPQNIARAGDPHKRIARRDLRPHSYMEKRTCVAVMAKKIGGKFGLKMA